MNKISCITYICNNTKCNNISFSKNLCFNHYRLKYLKYIIIIQKNYKSYIVRRKLKNIYIKLPNDLQLLIKKFMNYDLVTKKQHAILQKIIFKYSYNILFYINEYTSSITGDFNKIKISDIIKVYNLYIKYYNIINYNQLKYLHIINEKIYIAIVCHLSFFHDIHLIQNYVLFDVYVYGNIDFYQSTKNELFTCIRLIEFLQSKYINYNYQLFN